MAKHKKPSRSIIPPSRKARSLREPSSEKTPRSADKSQPTDNETIVWRINIICQTGTWSWKNVSGNKFWTHIVEKMSHFETMTWAEIKKNKHNNHSVSISQICREAYNYLRDTGLNDVDDLFVLRLSSRERIWGIRDRRALKILWWDPEHTVYPTVKHT